MREKDRETVRVSVPGSMNQHRLVIEYEEGVREGEGGQILQCGP